MSSQLSQSEPSSSRKTMRRARAQGRNPQKFVALKMCPIAAAAKMGFPLEVEGHLSCSILVVVPRGAAAPHLILLHHYYSSLSKLLFLKP